MDNFTNGYFYCYKLVQNLSSNNKKEQKYFVIFC